MQRVMIAGTDSGCGKTTVTCSVISALKHRKINVSAYKCGPDYIDPMFYRKILGTPSHNLDSFFCDQDTLCEVLESNSMDANISVIEGAMGFYDGADGSAYQISEITDTPVILVLNCRGMKESIGAVMQGFLQYKSPNHIIGFIFNQLSERLIPFAEELCKQLHTEYFGCLPVHQFRLESRHLGLITANEISNIHQKMDSLGDLAAQYIHIDKILKLKCNDLPICHHSSLTKLKNKPVIAVAYDHAFCFIYEENLTILREIGCEIEFFSPLNDTHLPTADALILCGGYPELYAEKLSQNTTMLNDIKNAILYKMPVIAECGGFMYLHDYLVTENGKKYPMAGVIPGETFPKKKLQRFGYITMRASADYLLCKAGEMLKAHEFHYWDSTNAGTGFCAQKSDGRTWDCCHISNTMYAGFPHLYFPSNIQIAQRFASAAAAFRGKNETYSTN